jgi:AcrR family transcriptional regulator
MKLSDRIVKNIRSYTLLGMPKETHGARRRREILSAAADLSTSEGLEGLSFRRIAEEVGLSKAGVAAHFESKEALQLAVVDAAAAAYAAPLVAASKNSEAGLPRLRALALAWLGHLETIEYRGGCFFGSAGLAFAGRPGLVHDAIANQTRSFLRLLEEQAQLAARLGECSPDVSPELLAFQIHALAQEANLRRELLDTDDAFEQARQALSDLILRASSAAELSPSLQERAKESS